MEATPGKAKQSAADDDEETVIIMESDGSRGDDWDVEEKRPFTLMPRISRSRFVALLWLIAACEAAAWFAPDYVSQFLGIQLTIQENALAQIAIHSFAVLLLVYISAMRLRDMDRSGSLFILLFVPVLNLFLLGLLLLAPGTKNWNQFGPEPRASGALTQLLGVYVPLLLIIAGGVGVYLHQELAISYLDQFTIQLAQLTELPISF